MTGATLTMAALATALASSLLLRLPLRHLRTSFRLIDIAINR